MTAVDALQILRPKGPWRPAAVQARRFFTSAASRLGWSGDIDAMKQPNSHKTLRPIGTTVNFYVPRKKLGRRLASGDKRRASKVMSDFFLEHFGGFTHETSRIQGYWVGGHGQTITDKHERFEVSVPGRTKADLLFKFLGQLCTQLDESSIYTTYNGRTWLVTPASVTKRGTSR
jgi:hypothetical protein